MISVDERGPLFLLIDEPIVSAEDDFLNRNREAAAIAATVLGTDGPFTICICGEWGIGKTSFLRHVQSILEESEPGTNGRRRYPNVITVFFNAWRYESDQAPLAHLAALIQEKVDLALRNAHGMAGSIADATRSFANNLLRTLRAGVEFRTAPLGGMGQLAIQVSRDPASVERHSKHLDGQDAPINEHIGSAVSEAALRSIGRNSATVGSLELQHDITPRIVVFVDDLDRCQPEAALKVLQSIKLAFAEPGCFFILSLDPDRVIGPENKPDDVTVKGDSIEARRKMFLDKLVQLSFRLRLSPHNFSSFVDAVIDNRLRPKLPPLESSIFGSLRRLFELCADHNPRSLIRRINTVLLDGRFIGREQLNLLDDTPERAMELFCGASLISHTLRAFCSSAVVDGLSTSQELCDLIGRHGLRRCSLALRQPDEDPIVKQARPEDEFSESAAKVIHDNRGIILELNQKVELDTILRSTQGKSWLQRAALRKLVDELYFKGDEGSQFLPGFYGLVAIPSKDQCSLIQRAIVEGTGIQDRSDLTRGALERIIAIKFENDPLCDEAVAYLSHRSSPLTSLKHLNLNRTAVSDRSLNSLSDRECPFQLTSLGLDGTCVSDLGIKAMTSVSSRLFGLSELGIAHTLVTDEGLAILASDSSAIRSLTELFLWDLPITDEGISLLAKSVRFAGLSGLYAAGTRIGDDAVDSLTSTQSRIRKLQTLNLRGTKVSDRGLDLLCRKASALQSLTTLCIDDLPVSSSTLFKLLEAENGLSSVKILYLRAVPVTPEWLERLGREKSALPQLKQLFITASPQFRAALKKLGKTRQHVMIEAA